MRNILLLIAVILPIALPLEVRADPPSSPPPISTSAAASSSDQEERLTGVCAPTSADLARRLLVLEAVVPRLRDRVRACEGATPGWTGELRLGVGVDGGGAWDAFHRGAALVEGQLASPPLLGGATVNVLVRHVAGDNWYWRSQRKLVLGLRVPVGRDVAVFGDWERRYSVNDGFTVGGLAFRLDGS